MLNLKPRFHCIQVLYTRLANYIDINEWKYLYERAYREWLHDISDTVYNIHDQINLSMVNALLQLNEALNDRCIYYWFDIDRIFGSIVQFQEGD